jgi:hypothetical protein
MGTGATPMARNPKSILTLKQGAPGASQRLAIRSTTTYHYVISGPRAPTDAVARHVTPAEVDNMSDDIDRYHRLKTQPTHRQTAATVSWVQGFSAGWSAAASRWLTTPGVNHAGPAATLAALTDQLQHVTLDGLNLAIRFRGTLEQLAAAIRQADDDTTTWDTHPCP